MCPPGFVPAFVTLPDGTKFSLCLPELIDATTQITKEELLDFEAQEVESDYWSCEDYKSFQRHEVASYYEENLDFYNRDSALKYENMTVPDIADTMTEMLKDHHIVPPLIKCAIKKDADPKWTVPPRGTPTPEV